MSGELSITEVAVNQTGKEATINEALHQLEVAIAASFDVDATADVAVTSDQLKRCGVLNVKNATAAHTVTLAAVKRRLLVTADATMTHSVTLACGTGTVLLPVGGRIDVQLDGTANGIFALGGGGGSLPSGGTTGQVLTKNSGTDGDAGWATPSGGGGGGGGGITPISARYWQLTMANATEGLVAMAEATIRGAYKKAPLTGTWTASSSYSGLGIANLHDTDVTTVWASNLETPCTVSIDLGAAANVAGFTFTARADSSSRQAPKTVVIKHSSDGTTYTTVDTYTFDVWGQATTQEIYFFA